MAHFAKIDDNNIVTEIIVAEQDFIDTLEGTWVQTSYNKTIRKNYAGVGFTYDSDRDAFISPCKFNSWTLNETTCQWEPPIPYPGGGTPDDEVRYFWDESVYDADENDPKTEGWVEATL